MSRYTGPKNKLSRREGQDLFGRGNKLRRASTPPGQHGPKGARRLSGYGQRLREKQKTKRLYGIVERQFRKYFEKASRFRGSTGEKLLQLLESRLDNIIYRLGYTPTRAMARQIVNHGHVLVNGKSVTIPSYQVKIGELVSLDSKIAETPVVKNLLENFAGTMPSWLEKQAISGKMKALPDRSEIDGNINEQLIVEFYSH